MPDIKTRWANKAARRQEWANSARAKADALLVEDPRGRDLAFLTQPGHIPARARMIDRADRAADLLAKAAEHDRKAQSLHTMATRQAGDAERARQSIRDRLDLQPGDRAVSVHYGPCEIVRVNTKTFRIQLSSGTVTTQDKSYIKRA